jgi:VIT1/CCC1 family predicted Fe2+/Mn2+ transporter
MVPLLPFILPFAPEQAFAASATMTAVAFAGVGAVKGRLVGGSALRSGLGTLVVGGAAALLAYLVGVILKAAFGAA